MILEDILNDIKKDSVIDQANLDRSSLLISELHAKWYRILSAETMLLKKCMNEKCCVLKDRTEYYLGRKPDSAYVEEPLQLKIIQKDLPLYLDADQKVIEISNKVQSQTVKVNVIEGFIKELNQRSFNIKNAIDYMKFKNGGM